VVIRIDENLPHPGYLLKKVCGPSNIVLGLSGSFHHLTKPDASTLPVGALNDRPVQRSDAFVIEDSV
jgi:hypothetical protein